MKNFEVLLDQYAETVVKIGLNLQKGQRLIISSPLEAAEFTRKVTRHAYKAGAKRVIIDWSDSESQRIYFEEAPEETLKQIEQWEIDRYKDLADHKDALLHITGSDPKALEGVNPERITMRQKASGEKLEFFSKAQMNGHLTWCIVGVPTQAWAKTVFPDRSEEEAVDALWEAIFKTVRVDQEDPIAAWEGHVQNLNDKVEYLTQKKFKALHYKAPGTDLVIELHPKHIWVGGPHHSANGDLFIPNLPTEEVFTTPLKEGVNGTVTSTKPLSAMGNMIENFSLTFEKGRVVDFKAEKGQEALKELLNIDEGMHYLGEVALVPDDSPISNSGIIFNNTLYDENASCHIALGGAIDMSVEGAAPMSRDELEEIGVNQSFGHTDFMIGSAELDLDGETEDGTLIPLFRKGNWVI